jgi:uncharacterized protein YjiK
MRVNYWLARKITSQEVARTLLFALDAAGLRVVEVTPTGKLVFDIPLDKYIDPLFSQQVEHIAERIVH